MEQILKNSKHAATSTLDVTTTKQMRATFIYFAPFLQPCKNVITTIPTTTATTKTTANTLEQQTHVPHNRLNSSRNKHNNTNIDINMTGTRPCRCSHTATTLTANSAASSLYTLQQQNHHYHLQEHHKHHEKQSCSSNNNNNSCICMSIGSGDGDEHTSCWHNNNNNALKQQQTVQHHEEKQVKNKKQQQKDEYLKNYEMPALETTTTIKTVTTASTLLYHPSYNKLIQETQHKQQKQQQQQVVYLTKQIGSQEQQQQQQQLQQLTTNTTTSTLTSLCSSPLSTSFVNNTNNNRSIKHLRERERNRRNIITLQKQQQQPLEQTVKDKITHATILKGEQKQENQQQKITCVGGCDTLSNCACVRAASGGLYVLKESVKSNVNQQMASAIVMSRCHFYNRQPYNNNIMLSNVQDIKQQQQQQTNIQLLLNKQQQERQQQQEVVAIVEEDITSHDCDDQQLNFYIENAQREEANENNNFNINLRLSKNLNEVNHKPKPKQEQKQQQDKNSYINYNELLFYSNPTTITTTTTTSLIIPTLISKHSYTTILNKECRCFIQKQEEYKRDTITGSEYLNRSTPQPLLTYCRTISACNGNSSNSISSLHQSFTKLWPQAINSCFRLSKTVAVSKWLFMWLLMAMLSTSAHCWAGRNDVPTNCTFPARWEGSWFLSGYQQSIHIKGSQFSYRGRCAASDGNKYLIVDEKGCHRCLVIYEKHNNVLQYKESECEGDSMYMHQTNPSAMAMRSVLNQKTNNNGGDHRGGAHPNLNGHSRLSSSDQYIMRSNDDMNDYFCKGRETLQNLCDQIPGDALLYSLFRESAEPVKCPLKGPFIFTYNRGNGECKNPVSNIESCTEDSRLLLSFQACPDVVGTESTVEELTCLATWKDGNSRYLVGLVSHHHAISNEERYRCFVYEKISSLMDLGHFSGPSISTSKDAEYKLAQSGDATCNGLDSAEVGSRIMSLRKPPVTERCDFPVWFKGPRHWHVLMGNAVYNYHTNDGSIHIIKPNGYMETRALCEQINKQTSTEMMSVVHYTTGCQSGFMCMMFYRRDTHVIEIQTGKPASRLEDACAPDHFDINKTPYITLLASNPDPQICPMEGLYSLRGAIGPPYLTTRHKRNHNKAHGLHNHHHQYESNNGRELMHKRHSSLSFRNSNHDEKNAWHSNTRGLPVRSRRDASSTMTPLNTIGLNQSQAVIKTTQEILVVGNNTSVGFVQDAFSDSRLRSRRNVPECVTNYKAQRQLWVGCTEPNVIDVRPLCNDEGDEEYSCHGSWSENGTVFIIARHKGTKHGVCISYMPTEGTLAKLVVGDACYRGTQKPPEHHLVANLSVFGKCGETGSTSSTMPIVSWFNLLLATILITIMTQLPIQR